VNEQQKNLGELPWEDLPRHMLPFLITSRYHPGKTHLSAVYIHNIEFHPNPCARFGADEFGGESWHIVIAILDWVDGLVICDWRSLGYDYAHCCRISFGCAGTDKTIALKVFFCGVFSAILFTHTHIHTYICIQDHVPATKLQCNKFDQFRFSVNYGSVVQWVHKEHSIKKWNQLQASQRIEAMKERIWPKFWCDKWWRSGLKMLQGTNP
jgi:hypothetical protein